MSNDPASLESSRPIEPLAAEHVESPSGPLKYGVVGGVFWAAIGGALMWVFLHYHFEVFRLPEEFEHAPPMPSAQWTEDFLAAQVVARGHNTVFALGLFSALVAGLFAVGNGVVRRSMSAALVAGAICAGLAGAAGCAAGLAGHAVWKACVSNSGTMPLSSAVLMHATTFAIMGGGVGAAQGWVAARKAPAFLAHLAVGVLAGATAGMVYPFLSAVLAAYFGFQGQTDVVVPAGDLNRALWVAVPTLLLGMIIPGMKSTRSK